MSFEIDDKGYLVIDLDFNEIKERFHCVSGANLELFFLSHGEKVILISDDDVSKIFKYPSLNKTHLKNIKKIRKKLANFFGSSGTVEVVGIKEFKFNGIDEEVEAYSIKNVKGEIKKGIPGIFFRHLN